MALLAPPKCQKLSHKSCGAFRCPCDEARAWLRSLPKRIPVAKIWERCTRPDWMQWLATQVGLSTKGQKDCDEIRKAFPWSAIADALAKPAPSGGCDDCGDVVPIEELCDGRCESCDDSYTYCRICEERVHQESLCDHLRWSNAFGTEMGTGSDDPVMHRVPFDALLARLGRRRARKLRHSLRTGTWWTYDCDRDLAEAVERIEDRASDTDDRDKVEVGLIWLKTLGRGESLQPDVAHTIGWIDAHLAAREVEIAADVRPRFVIRDGGGRYYDREADIWTAVREHASWMYASRARDVAEALRGVHPDAIVRVVHVLTPHRRIER